MKQKNFFRKKATVIFLLFACMADGFALDYTISFTGSGANTSVDSTVVQNITKGTSVTVPFGQVLYLTDVITNVNNTTGNNESVLLFPNPIKEVSMLSFNTPNKGYVNINISDISGRIIYSVTQNAEAGQNSFNVSLPKGIFFIHISGKGMSYTQKAVSSSNNTLKPFVSGITTQFRNIQKAKSSVGVAMLFNDGDVLQYNGNAGNNSTIITDSPTGDKTVNFEFVECKDASNNYYGISKIGDYYWMTSNLKTTKFRNGEEIPNVTDATDWKYLYSPGWCEQNNDPNNGLIYGKLYNYYAAADERNIAPPCWHVATQEEFANLVSHVSIH